MQFKFLNYEFKTNWLSVAIVLCCVPLFIKLGLWQYHKGMDRLHIEDAYQLSLHQQPIELVNHLKSAEELQYRKVKVQGLYETHYQILIDNQVEQDQVGYHVVTPFKIANTNQYVLVNRGWVAGMKSRDELPLIITPTEMQEIEGLVWLPSSKIFTLESPSIQNKWETVWQHLDMKKYQKLAPFPILNVIIKLDGNVKTGGFVRNWQLPPSKIATNLGYAYQWFGFAFSAIAIFLYLSIHKVRVNE